MDVNSWIHHDMCRRQSGQSILKYCRDNGISEPQWHYYRRKATRSSGEFMELKSALASPLYITSPKGWRLEILPDSDLKLLKMVSEVLL